MKIVSVVVTYNRLALLKECLEALQKYASETEILIIDNASTDGTADWLAEEQKKNPTLQVITSKKNLGGAGGFALGMEEAVKRGADYVWIMDDDTIINQDSLPEVVKEARKHPEALFFSSRALWTDGTDNKMNAHRLLEKEDGERAVLCREATFVSLFVSTEAIVKYGLPIAEFFIWGDDIEYTRRLSHQGKGYYVPKSQVLHKTASNAGSDIVHDSEQRLPRYRYAYRNEVFIAKEEGLFRSCRQIAKILYHTGKVLLFSRGNKGRKIRLIYSASAEGMHFHPAIRYPKKPATPSAFSEQKVDGKSDAAPAAENRSAEKKKPPLRVLEVFREPLANGGQESFIMNMYRNMDHEKVQMDFMTPFGADNPNLVQEIESLGGWVYAYNHSFEEKQNQGFKESLRQFFKDHAGEYSIVHFHSGSTYALMEGPKLAAQAGIENRIVHSHCGGFANLKYHVIKAISVPYFLKYPTQFCACSMVAARWKFPASVIEQGKVRILPNAVDLERFAFSENRRNETRKAMQAEDRIILGHVGRFSLQKNHAFLIEIFEAFHKKHPDSELWMAGVGELQQQIRDLVEQKGLNDSVRFLNLRKDVPDLFNAMDVLVLPSFFEGLPVVGVEAQACALPVVCSDQITRELPLPALSSFVPLGKEHLPEWTAALEQAVSKPRTDQKEAMKAAGYDVKQAAKAMENMYLEMEDHA